MKTANQESDCEKETTKARKKKEEQRIKSTTTLHTDSSQPSAKGVSFASSIDVLCSNVCMRYLHRRFNSRVIFRCCCFVFVFPLLSVCVLSFSIFFFSFQLLFDSFIVSFFAALNRRETIYCFALLNVFNVVASALLFIRCVHVIFFFCCCPFSLVRPGTNHLEKNCKTKCGKKAANDK